MKQIMNRLPVIMVSSGGLGNQLFIVALAHHIAKKGNKVIVLDSPHNRRGHDSAGLSQFCSHKISYWNRPIRLRLLQPQLLNRVIDYFHGAAIKCLTYMATDVTESYVKKGEYNFGLLLKGCLQRSEIVVLNPEFTSELINRIKQEKIPEVEASKPLLHVRRGDYTLSGYYGLLSVDYYSAALNFLGKSAALVISDDPATGNVISKELGGNFLETSNVTPFGLLALMFESEIVVSANSSLSWWGGFLANFRGGRHLIPTPWLINTADEGRWLFYDGCEDVASVFEVD